MGVVVSPMKDGECPKPAQDPCNPTLGRSQVTQIRGAQQYDSRNPVTTNVGTCRIHRALCCEQYHLIIHCHYYGGPVCRGVRAPVEISPPAPRAGAPRQVDRFFAQLQKVLADSWSSESWVGSLSLLFAHVPSAYTRI